VGFGLGVRFLRCERRRRGPLRVATGAALAAILFSGRATATEPLTPIRIAYSAPASCPDALGLFAHVQARTARARVALPNEKALELAVRVEETNRRFRGRLVVAASSKGPRQEREVTDASCDELIEALGFFIALAVDVHAKTSASTTPLPPPPPAATPAESKTEPPPSSVSLPPMPARAAATGPEERHSDPNHRGVWQFGGGAGAMLVGGIAPKALLGTRVFVDVSRERSGDSILTPFVSVGAISTATGIDYTPLGGSALRWQALIGTVCPLALPLFSTAVFRPCSMLEVGRLRGEGLNVKNARRTEAEWVGIGLSGRLELAILSNLFIELEVGGSTPILRPRFDYSSGVTSFIPAVLGGRTSLTFAVRL
jgi:hypothetical protein